mmetsp:Transcript_33324/g.89208  ORF Transcript_33324/g.89208 Transcript_33324/m.89208 type:complete len:117 (-) Transcript_33324:272-622(-)
MHGSLGVPGVTTDEKENATVLLVRSVLEEIGLAVRRDLERGHVDGRREGAGSEATAAVAKAPSGRREATVRIAAPAMSTEVLVTLETGNVSAKNRQAGAARTRIELVPEAGADVDR